MRFLKGIISKNKILKNFSVLIVSNAFSQILFMLSSIKIARSLTPVLFGAYNLLFVHVLIFGGLASLGLRNIIIRSVARDNGIVKRVFFISIILRAIGFLLSIILFCTYFILYPSYDDFLFILVILCILSNLLFDLSESVAFGLEKMEFSGVIILLNALFWFLTILLIPKSMFTLHLIFSLFVFFNSLKTIIYFFSIYKAGFIKGFILEHFEKRQIIEFSKLSFPYYYLDLFTLISNQIPLLFLEYRSGVAQIGFLDRKSVV